MHPQAYGAAKLPPGELTALHIAAERGSAELVRVLVGAGAKVNVQVGRRAAGRGGEGRGGGMGEAPR